MADNRDRRLPSSSPRLATSALSPFPFGTPITSSDRSRLSPGRNSSLLGNTSLASDYNSTVLNSSLNVIRGRVRAQDVYGGQVMFGGSSSSLRRNRLLAASPYQGAAALRHNRFNNDSNARPSSSNAPTPSTSKSTTPTSDDGMSSTARLILDTLEKMSTPVRDAQKIPIVARAEKRRQIMSELESSLVDSSSMSNSKRRRPNLSAHKTSSMSSPHNRTLLNGPPVRSLMPPVLSTPTSTNRLRSGPITSARISSSSASTPTATSMPSRTSFSAAATTAASPVVSSFSFGNATSQSVTSTPASSSVQFGSATNYQIPFSVPALSGGGGGASTSKPSEPVKSATISPVSTSFFSTGKIRARVGDNKKSEAALEILPEPLPPHLAKPISSGLELKQLPNFGSGLFSTTEKKSSETTVPTTTTAAKPSGFSQESSTSSSGKTADTILLSPERKTASSESSPTMKPVFKFSDPVVVSKPDVKPMSDNWSKMNGSLSSEKRFTFSKPGEVAPSCTLTTVDSSSSPSSSIKSSFVMPDLTFSTNNNKLTTVQQRKPGSGDDFMFPVKPLKTGSVMDILGGNNKLPDVTASTSAKVNSESKILGGFGTAETSSWDPKFKFGQLNNWS